MQFRQIIVKLPRVLFSRSGTIFGVFQTAHFIVTLEIILKDWIFSGILNSPFKISPYLITQQVRQKHKRPQEFPNFNGCSAGGLSPPEHVVDGHDAMWARGARVVDDGGAALQPHPASVTGQEAVVFARHLALRQHCAGEEG